jgi:hypothetical protein
MYDTGKILIGLVIFVAIVTVPFWYNGITGKASAVPEPEIKTDAKQCVEATAFMKESHMKLLDEWRDEVVRNQERLYEGIDGKTFDMSLTNTCLDCHSNKDAFCDRCHDYVGVSPTCWNCHVIPEETS